MKLGSAFMLNNGQLKNDTGPRLVSMVRSIEGMLGFYQVPYEKCLRSNSTLDL